jgi:hypothetical protein
MAWFERIFTRESLFSHSVLRVSLVLSSAFDARPAVGLRGAENSVALAADFADSRSPVLGDDLANALENPLRAPSGIEGALSACEWECGAVESVLE